MTKQDNKKAIATCQSPTPATSALPDEELLVDLADLYKVFGDTTRLKILYALLDSPYRVGELAERVGSTQSAVSHQLKVLRADHLVRYTRDGRHITYAIADDHVRSILECGMEHICE